MNASAHIVEIDESNAQQLLIEESMARPVVVDFWADWCGPCKQLMPILEKLADEYQGAFLLAKVNADEQQMLAQQLGVRSLPTVMVIKDGQPIDGFQGAHAQLLHPNLLFGRCSTSTCHRPRPAHWLKRSSCFKLAIFPVRSHCTAAPGRSRGKSSI